MIRLSISRAEICVPQSGQEKGGAGPDGLSLPGKYALLANYPNPFNPSTTLQFELPQGDKVSLIVYDLTGREIRSLISSELPAGRHRVVWNGRDGRGHGVATGVYFYRIITGSGFTSTRKMVFMK